MDYFEWNTAKNKDLLIQEISTRFATGEVGILPTETVYGLMCLMGNSASHERIYRIKKREAKKKLQVLISSIADLALLQVQATRELKLLADKFWPGPLTVVIKNDQGREIGIRIPNHAVPRKVLQTLGSPLFSSSANLSGNSSVDSFSKQFSDLAEPPDFAVLAGELTGTPSTVIRLDHNKIHLIRPGALALDTIENTLG